jgi:fructose-1,6-bisphosphatase/inositol monophosphatase family enzyme
VDDDDLMGVLDATVEAVWTALAAVTDWRPTTERPSQYAIDVAADEAAVRVLVDAGLGVLSEETGRHHPGRPVTVVVDPVDGSTNASRRLPWYACSLCAVDADGPCAALVVNLATGQRFDAVRGGGARCDGAPITPSGVTDLDAAIVGITALLPPPAPWHQARAFGAAALDLCLVAAGSLDGYLATGPPRHGPWDYLGALLVCREAGVELVDGDGQDLVVLDHDARRAPIAGATPALTSALADVRRRTLAP